jgi:phosphatidylglycerol:prolipoprotein diacylglycerol transferase
MAVLAGLWILVTDAERQALPVAAVFWAGLASAAAGLLGTRLYFAMVDAPHGIAELDGPLALWQSGASSLGGFLLGGIAAVTAAWSIGVPVLRFLDRLMLPAAVGIAIMRVGCFLHGCCFGRSFEGPWAVRFPADTDAYRHLVADIGTGAQVLTPPVHPVQLYVAFGALAVGGLLYWMGRRALPDGALLGIFGAGYALVGFAGEVFRGDAVIVAGGMTDPQIAALIAAPISLVFLSRLQWKRTHAHS